MIYAVFSDIHANLEAFQAVMEHMKEIRAERFICLGDIVGYGANPHECLKMVQDIKDTVCAGNHDHAAANLIDTSYFNPYARRAVDWTSVQLDNADLKYIKTFPYIYEEDDFCVVHSNLKKPESWGYIFDEFEAGTNFAEMKKQICFIGHSHVPLAFEKDEFIQPIYETTRITIKENCSYIINVGSVGQPRDGDPRASYCIYDSAKKTVQWYRINYDILTAQKKIIQAGLPYFLAERIQIGR
jgi:predicted phosphodiesterase